MDEKNRNEACYPPGERVPISGIYRNPHTGERATCVRDEPFPPTSGEGQCWQLEIPADPDLREG